MNRLYRLFLCLFLLFVYGCAGTPESESETSPVIEDAEMASGTDETADKADDTVRKEESNVIDTPKNEIEEQEAQTEEQAAEAEAEEESEAAEQKMQAVTNLPPEIEGENTDIPLYEPALELNEPIPEEPAPLSPDSKDGSALKDPAAESLDKAPVESVPDDESGTEAVQTQGVSESEDETKAAEAVEDTGILPAPLPLPVGDIPELPSRQDVRTEDEQIIYSRTVRATVGQLVEIPFYGSGWVYLGELGSRRGLPYDSRRLDADGQSFVFRAEAVGTYSLKFYKQDFIRDYILNDYVQVVVGEAPAASSVGGFAPPVDRSRIVALPRWPVSETESSPTAGSDSRTSSINTDASVPTAARSPAQNQTDVQPEPDTGDDSVQAEESVRSTEPQTQARSAQTGQTQAGPEQASPAQASQTQPAQDVISDDGIIAVNPVAPVLSTPQQESGSFSDYTGPEAYLNEARAAYDKGDFMQALHILDRFRDRYPAGSDEAWWLYGRVLEANGAQRDIRAALGFYRRLVNEYPYSSRYDDARKRINYLERFYIEIR